MFFFSKNVQKANAQIEEEDLHTVPFEYYIGPATGRVYTFNREHFWKMFSEGSENYRKIMELLNGGATHSSRGGNYFNLVSRDGKDEELRKWLNTIRVPR